MQDKSYKKLEVYMEEKKDSMNPSLLDISTSICVKVP